MTSAVTPLTAITTISNVETLFASVLLGALVPGAIGGLALVPGALGGLALVLGALGGLALVPGALGGLALVPGALGELALVPGALGRLVLFWDPVVSVIVEPAILGLVDAIVEPAILVLVYTVEGEGWSSRVGEAVVVSCDRMTGAKLNK